MGALSASINVPSSILSTGGEAGSSSAVNEEGAPAPSSATNVQSGSALDGFGGKKDICKCENCILGYFQPSTLAVGFHLKFAQKQLFYKIKFETWIRPVLNLPADSEGEIKTGPNISLHTVFDLFLDQRCHWVWYIMYVFWCLKLLTNLKKCL